MFDEENLISLAIIFTNYYLVLPVLDFILCLKKKDLNGRETIFKEIYELSDVSYSRSQVYINILCSSIYWARG